MSFVIDLYCDGENCVRNGEPFWTALLTTRVRDLRVDAKNRGWIRARKKDYCPSCAKKIKESK